MNPKANARKSARYVINTLTRLLMNNFPS